MEPSETKPKIVKTRKPRQPKSDSARKDKTIKIKLTAKANANRDYDDNRIYNGNNSEEEEEPEAAIEEQLIFRVPEGEMCNRLHELVKKREIPEDVKLHFRGEISLQPSTTYTRY